MSYHLIVAIDNKNGIGKNGKMPWDFKEDLKHFSKLTTGNGNNAVIMGKNTWLSINSKCLPNRINIVVTRNKKWNYPNVLVSSGVPEAIKMANDIDENVFIIGGAEIYKEGISYCSNLEITEVHGVFRGDAWLCNYKNDFFETSRESHEIDNKHKVGFDFVQYQQK